MKMLARFSAPLAALALTASAASVPRPTTSGPSSHSDPELDRDRKAILAMAGEFQVDFRFQETTALKPGYTLHPPDVQRGHELVAIIEDTGTHISLQHVLVVEHGIAIKHWRQDWDYQRTDLWRYIGDSTWEQRRLDPERVQACWAQTVWQVDDSPRYAGIGKWQHGIQTSTWTSERVWRPLPRREYTTRSDYDVLLAVNRHIITPSGWVQEEDNEKLDRKAARGPQLLVSEIGINRYRRIHNYDFEPARAYLGRTQNYWRAVRSAWSELLGSNTRISVQPMVGQKRLYEVMLEKADEYSGISHQPDRLRSVIAAALAPYVFASHERSQPTSPLHLHSAILKDHSLG